MIRGARWPGVLGIVAVSLVSSAALLDDFWKLVQTNDLGVAGSDIATHYLRTLHARDFYLPSGHRFGWDPFWFQGYVPFLLYPHLPYVLLAALSLLIPVDLARLFNFYILTIYFALPLVAGLTVLRRLGVVPAIVATAWFSVLSTTGAGLTGVFVVGLLSQQLGLVLFTLLAIEVVIARRLDRAAIWLGLIPLVHVHASLIAGLAWLCAGGAALSDSREGAFRSWLWGSALASLIAFPTLVGLFHGWGDVGSATQFGEMERLLERLLGGTMLVPRPTLLAVGICLVATLVVVSGGQKARFWIWWYPLGMVLMALSVHRWSAGPPLVERILETMLYIRTLPFAFAWAAVVAICFWYRFPRVVRAGVIALSLASAVMPRHDEAAAARNIGSVWRGASTSSGESVTDYRAALKWISTDLGNETATLALAVPRPRATWLLAAIDRCEQPLLGGHGVELTSVNNQHLLTRTMRLPCETIQRQVQDYVIGYVAGTNVEQRAKLESCLSRTASVVVGNWWVIATGARWGLTPPAVAGFEHDRTWANLEWKLRQHDRKFQTRLPMAKNSQWLAEVDGVPVAIQSTYDGMMRVALPAGGERLRLHYQGYPGEWWSVAIAIAALTIAIIRASREGRHLNAPDGRATVPDYEL